MPSSLLLDYEHATARVRVPGPEDNKYTRGTVLMATGSPTYPRAAVLGTMGAALTGAGLVRYLGPEPCEQLVLSRLPEVVVGGGRADVTVVGSGWDASMASVADRLAHECAATGKPLVVDAGALPGVREWAAGGASIVATPHPGEAVELLRGLGVAVSRDSVESDVSGYAAQIAEGLGAVVVLKASDTCVAAPSGRTYLFRAPSGWGGTAGAGDVLAGVIATAIAAGWARPTGSKDEGDQVGEGTGRLGSAAPRATARDLDRLAEAAAVGVILHGLAASLASGTLEVRADVSMGAADTSTAAVTRLGSTGLPGRPIVASQIAECLPSAVGAIVAVSTHATDETAC